MHMIGTNLSVWLNVLIQETKHEILLFYDPTNNTLSLQTNRKQQQNGEYSVSLLLIGYPMWKENTKFGKIEWIF